MGFISLAGSGSIVATSGKKTTDTVPLIYPSTNDGAPMVSISAGMLEFMGLHKRQRINSLVIIDNEEAHKTFGTTNVQQKPLGGVKTITVLLTKGVLSNYDVFEDKVRASMGVEEFKADGAAAINKFMDGAVRTKSVGDRILSNGFSSTNTVRALRSSDGGRLNYTVSTIYGVAVIDEKGTEIIITKETPLTLPALAYYHLVTNDVGSFDVVKNHNVKEVLTHNPFFVLIPTEVKSKVEKTTEVDSLDELEEYNFSADNTTL